MHIAELFKSCLTLCNIFFQLLKKLHYGVEGSALISASQESLLSYHSYQNYMVLITDTVLYITSLPL